MDEIRIDHLSLLLSGLTEHDSRRLVHLITEGLAAAELPAAVARSVGALRVELGPRHHTVEAISQHVVGEVVRQLQGSAVASTSPSTPARAPKAGR